MENGMGMLTGEPGVPTTEDYGPSLGRGMGFGSTNDFPKTNGPLSEQDSKQNPHGMDMGTMNGEIAPNADSVPGFPQDAYMEGPMMAMDEMVEKPQNYGLPRGWSRFMQGMMAFVRVLPPDKYDEVMERVHRGGKSNMPEMPNMNVHEMPGMQHPK
jgi:hypothetical protein